MRERAEILGGNLSAGPAAGGGWDVATALALTALVAIVFTRLESRPAPPAAVSVRRLAFGTLSGLIGIVLLLAAGTSVATALIAIALITGALRLASRTVPRPSPVAGTLVA